MATINMSIKNLNPLLNSALAVVPTILRSRLIKSYLDLKQNTYESRYDPAGMAAGKFCEVALRLLQHKIHGTYMPFGTRIINFADECRQLTMAPACSGNESERLVLPRALNFLYTMRNKRGIGHIGGDIDANGIDVATMAGISDWIICELIRINHGVSLEEAQDIVDSIAVRQLPTIWEVCGKKRVLKDGLKASDQALLLLYSCPDSAVLLEDLTSWVEYSNPRMFKHAVIQKLHKQRFLEFDAESESVVLSPKGAKYVEESLI
jgi:hypothetical protein